MIKPGVVVNVDKYDAIRFWLKVDKTPSCWLWKAGKDRHGYGKFWLNDAKNMVEAHRVSYELLIEPIPDGLELDHLCRKPACVNPFHLEPVTHQENIRRYFALTPCHTRRECQKGHPLPHGGKCRECKREYMREYEKRRVRGPRR